MLNPSYERLRQSGAKLNETNDCSVVAYAATTGTDYETAHYILADLGERREGMPPKWENYLRAFRLMGYNLELISVSAKTMITLERDPVVQSGAYLVATCGSGHVVGVVDGQIIDWTKGRRNRIKFIWKVTQSESARVDMPASWANDRTWGHLFRAVNED